MPESSLIEVFVEEKRYCSPLYLGNVPGLLSNRSGRPLYPLADGTIGRGDRRTMQVQRSPDPFANIAGRLGTHPHCRQWSAMT